MFAIMFTVTFLILFVILLRVIFKQHISARLQYGIWLFVAVKLLIFPLPDVEGDFSVLGLAAEGRQEWFLGEAVSEGGEGAAEAGKMAQEEMPGGSEWNPWAADDQAAGKSGAVSTEMDMMPEYMGTGGKGLSGVARWCRMTRLGLRHYAETVLKMPIWFAGMLGAGSILCAVWMLIYHVRLRKYLKRKRVAVSEAGRKGMFRVYAVEGLPTPCLLGRSIYIPAGLAENEEFLPYILKHEMCHYFHGDVVWSVVRMICVCLYWYHPLVWLAAYLSGQDCELACDESVVRHMMEADRKRYGELLLELTPVKGFQTECFSATTAMSGSAKNLKQRLERITGKRKNWVIPGVLAVLAGSAGIYACITSGFVSVDKQWQSIQIRQEEGSLPIQRESYRLDYRLSKDAASYGLYVEQYEYGELISAEILDCAALRAEDSTERKQKRGEVLYERRLEADQDTGAFVKSINCYSVRDYSTADGAGSLFKAFTLELPGENCAGNSFSMAAAEKAEHRFRINEDIILLADYYGDREKGCMLSLPPGHVFESEKYMEKTGKIMKDDKCVILVHLIVSDRPAEELRKQIEELVRKKNDGETSRTVSAMENC